MHAVYYTYVYYNLHTVMHTLAVHALELVDRIQRIYGGWDPSAESDRHKSANVWIWANYYTWSPLTCTAIVVQCLYTRSLLHQKLDDRDVSSLRRRMYRGAPVHIHCMSTVDEYSG